MFNARQMRLQAAADTNIGTSRTNIPNECNEIVLKKKNDMINSFYNYAQKPRQERKVS